jgi:hypothetical protein
MVAAAPQDERRAAPPLEGDSRTGGVDMALAAEASRGSWKRREEEGVRAAARNPRARV